MTSIDLKKENRRHLGIDIPMETYDKLDKLQGITLLNKWAIVHEAVNEYYANKTLHNSEINAN